MSAGDFGEFYLVPPYTRAHTRARAHNGTYRRKSPKSPSVAIPGDCALTPRAEARGRDRGVRGFSVVAPSSAAPFSACGCPSCACVPSGYASLRFLTHPIEAQSAAHRPSRADTTGQHVRTSLDGARKCPSLLLVCTESVIRNPLVTEWRAPARDSLQHRASCRAPRIALRAPPAPPSASLHIIAAGRPCTAPDAPYCVLRAAA